MKKAVLLLIGIILLIVGVVVIKKMEKQRFADSQLPPTLQTTTEQSTTTMVQDEQLSLIIMEPVDNARVSTTSVTVKGQTAPNADVFINEKEIKADSTGVFSAPVLLEKGTNYILIAANDEAGNHVEKELTVEYTAY